MYLRKLTFVRKQVNLTTTGIALGLALSIALIIQVLWQYVPYQFKSVNHTNYGSRYTKKGYTYFIIFRTVVYPLISEEGFYVQAQTLFKEQDFFFRLFHKDFV